MESIEPSRESIKLSVEKTIDIIRNVRNDLIKDFLQDHNLKSFFTEQYNRELSAVKMEFLKRDLKELMISPVDLTHYSALIKQVRESNSACLTGGNQELFYRELESIFKKYNY